MSPCGIRRPQAQAPAHHTCPLPSGPFSRYKDPELPTQLPFPGSVLLKGRLHTKPRGRKGRCPLKFNSTDSHVYRKSPPRWAELGGGGGGVGHGLRARMQGHRRSRPSPCCRSLAREPEKSQDSRSELGLPGHRKLGGPCVFYTRL